jgi:hypothetical protein
MSHCPQCTDAVDLLPCATDEHPEDGLYCPRCGSPFVRGGPHQPRPREPERVSARGDVTGYPFALHVEPDGLVLLTMDPGPGQQRLTWRGTPEDLSRLARAAVHIRHEAKAIQDRLRGANRWAFRRDAGGFFARIYDSEARLVTWTSGGRRTTAAHNIGRSPQKCDSCRAELPRGRQGFRPLATPQGAMGSWDEVRFCAACVSTAPMPTARPALVAIDGGRTKARRA